MAVLVTVPVITVGDSVYYITPDDDSGECPTSDNCHTLKYYVDNNGFSNTINATFVFMEGQHQLGTDVTIDGVYKFSIVAFDRLSSSNPVITCSSPVGLWFSNSTSINIKNIAVSNCGNTSGALAFYNISGILALDSIAVANSNGRGMVMNEVESVEIRRCLFDSNGNGGIEMVDVQRIVIAKSSFIHNTAKYGRGEGGGLKISASLSCPILSLAYSNFTNNTALYGGGLLIDIKCGNMTVSNSHFSHNTVQRLGGGVRVRVSNGMYHPNFTFIQSTFEYNKVLGMDVLPGEPPAGGGVYMYLTDIEPTTTITVTECTFNGNNGYNYGGGFAINRNAEKAADSFSINTIIKHSLFQFNDATSTSGIHIEYTNSNTTISSCTFFNNSCSYGNLCYAQSVVTFVGRSSVVSKAIFYVHNCIFMDNGIIGLYSFRGLPSLTIINTTFNGEVQAINAALRDNATLTNVTVTSSSSGHGGIVLYCESLTTLTLSDLKIHDNQGTGIATVNCASIYFNGTNIIANNTASSDGGGMAIYGTGYFYIDPHATVSFINNTAGRYGGGMYIEKQSSSGYYYHECTVFYFSNANRACFSLNKAAVAGDNVYGGRYFQCSREDSSTPTRNNTVVAIDKRIPNSWYQPSLHSSKPYSIMSSDPIAVCLCDNDTVDCSIMSITRRVHSGESFNVSVAVVGLGGGVNSGSFVIATSSYLELVSNSFIASKSCKTFVYTPTLTHSINDQLNTNVALYIPNSLIPDGYLNISLFIQRCPLGLVLDTNNKYCVCNSVITSNAHGIKCNVSWMPHPIQYFENNWIGYYESLHCIIAHSGCPFDYCVSSTAKFSLNESDLQCNHDRSGVLCGQCRPGLSLMLGSNKCSQCSNDWLALVAVFAVSGVLLVVLLVSLNLTVSVGSINGLLFYANIVKLNEPAFFPRGNIPIVSQFIAWLNLDWGIETCFYNGLDGYWKVMLQFVFPVYLWFLVIVIIIACRHSFRVSRMCRHNAVPVLATLILMSYTKVLRTVTKSLMINTIECGDTRWNVWNVDGNILYLGGKHIVLFGVSMLFLVTGVIYTGLVFSSQWLQRYSGKCCKSTRDPVVKLKPLVDAYTGPYKDKYRFWMGLGLIVRVLLTVIFIFTSEKSSVFSSNFFIVLTVILTVTGSRVYRNRYNTIVEICSHVNLFVLALVATQLGINDTDGTSISPASTISVTLEMFLFLVIVVAHFHRAKKTFIERRGRWKRQSLNSTQIGNYGSFIKDPPSPGVCQVQREALIYYDN